jgi:ankyrin repeat protein
VEIVQALLAKGADINVKDSKGATAQASAVANGHKEVEAILKKAGAK